MICFLREEGKTEKQKAKSLNMCTPVWSWMLTLNHLSLHAEVMLKVCGRGWNRNRFMVFDVDLYICLTFLFN